MILSPISINQTGGGSASLTITGRRFTRDAVATINLTTAGDLTYNLNLINPEAATTTDSIQNAIDAIGTTQGNSIISLGAGTYNAATEVVIDKDLTIRGAGSTDTFIDGNSLFSSSFEIPSCPHDFFGFMQAMIFPRSFIVISWRDMVVLAFFRYVL